MHIRTFLKLKKITIYNFPKLSILPLPQHSTTLSTSTLKKTKRRDYQRITFYSDKKKTHDNTNFESCWRIDRDTHEHLQSHISQAALLTVRPIAIVHGVPDLQHNAIILGKGGGVPFSLLEADKQIFDQKCQQIRSKHDFRS